MPDPKPPPSLQKTIAAALVVVVPVLATTVAGYLESRQAKDAVAKQSEKHKVDVAQTDVWLRDQWLAQSRDTALLRAELAEIRGQVAVLAARRRDRDRDRAVERPARAPDASSVAEDFIEQVSPTTAVIPAPMPEKPNAFDVRVQTEVRKK